VPRAPSHDLIEPQDIQHLGAGGHILRWRPPVVACATPRPPARRNDNRAGQRPRTLASQPRGHSHAYSQHHVRTEPRTAAFNRSGPVHRARPFDRSASTDHSRSRRPAAHFTEGRLLRWSIGASYRALPVSADACCFDRVSCWTGCAKVHAVVREMNDEGDNSAVSTRRVGSGHPLPPTERVAPARANPNSARLEVGGSTLGFGPEATSAPARAAQP
jgi:hypothetical protein